MVRDICSKLEGEGAKKNVLTLRMYNSTDNTFQLRFDEHGKEWCYIKQHRHVIG